ncbi:MAG: hypothetical protein PHN22_02835 [Candidatus ainarchaeum sp.]|nr:hypothetical protein [Candidatus ainarchaeum sp.]
MKKNLIIAFSFLFLSLFFTGNLFAFDVPVTMKVTGDYVFESSVSNGLDIAYKINNDSLYSYNGSTNNSLSSQEVSNILTNGFYIGPITDDVTGNGETISLYVKIFNTENSSILVDITLILPNPNYDDSGSVELVADKVDGRVINNGNLTTNSVGSNQIINNTIGLYDLETEYLDCSDGQVLGVLKNNEDNSLYLACVDQASGSGDIALDAGQGIDIVQMCGSIPCINQISVKDNGIVTSMIADEQITRDKIDNDAVYTDQIDDGAITIDKLRNGVIDANKIQDNAVNINKIQDGAVSVQKLAVYNRDGDYPTDGATLEYDSGCDCLVWSNSQNYPTPLGTVNITSPSTGSDFLENNYSIDLQSTINPNNGVSTNSCKWMVNNSIVSDSCGNIVIAASDCGGLGECHIFRSVVFENSVGQIDSASDSIYINIISHV